MRLKRVRKATIIRISHTCVLLVSSHLETLVSNVKMLQTVLGVHQITTWTSRSATRVSKRSKDAQSVTHKGVPCARRVATSREALAKDVLTLKGARCVPTILVAKPARTATIGTVGGATAVVGG